MGHQISSPSPSRQRRYDPTPASTRKGTATRANTTTMRQRLMTRLLAPPPLVPPEPRSQALLGNARPRSSASRDSEPSRSVGLPSGAGATKQSFGASRSQAELGNEGSDS